MFKSKRTSIHDALDSTTTKLKDKAIEDKKTEDKYEEYSFSFQPGSILGPEAIATVVTVYKTKTIFGIKYKSKCYTNKFDNPKIDNRLFIKEFGHLNYEDFSKLATAAVEYYERAYKKKLEEQKLIQDRSLAEKILKIRRPKCQIE